MRRDAPAFELQGRIAEVAGDVRQDLGRASNPAAWTAAPRRVRRRTALSGGISAATVLALLPPRGALARTPEVLQTRPAANAVLGRQPVECLVRFAGPVDHYRSRLLIVRGDQVAATPHVRLDSAPDVLFGMAPALEPGDYELRWEVVTPGGSDQGQGAVPFAVRR
jgi:methionine-rich copper-binding protein CopC